MPDITRPTVRLSLIITPPTDRERDAFTIAQRVQRLEASLDAVRSVSLLWAFDRTDARFEDFEARLTEAAREAARAGTELMLALADDKLRREANVPVGTSDAAHRWSGSEPRSLTTWFGTVRYVRSYARPLAGGKGWFPLDTDLGLLDDRISPSLLTVSARLATRMSFAEAREVLGWFVPQPPSTEVVEQTVLGLGHHTEDWFVEAPKPEGDGEVLVVLIDGKCVPTARAEELEKRRGPRAGKPKAASPRHRGRADRKAAAPRPRRKKGDKSKNGKMTTTVVMYTLRQDGELLLGPLNRRVYASFGPKRHAFEYAVAEAERRGFAAGTRRTVQILTDGDPNLHTYTDEYFPRSKFPNRVVTVDVVHVLEKLWDAGRARHREGSPELAAWVHVQEDRLYADDAKSIVAELRVWLDQTPKTGPGNKGKRTRLTDAIRYLDSRLDKFNHGTCRARDLEVGTGQVEGAIKHVIAKRCDHGGMRWVRSRAQAVVQLRCIDVNGHWDAFTTFALTRLRARSLAGRLPVRLQTQSAAKLPSEKVAA